MTRELFKEFSYESFKSMVDYLEKSLKCILHGGFLTHQLDIVVVLVNKIIMYIRSQNYTKMD